MGNSVLIGVTVDHLCHYPEEQFSTIALGHMCSLFFLFELILRLSVYRCQFFTIPGARNWNWFDTVLVLFSIFDFAIATLSSGEGTGSIGSGLKTVKMLRILRVFRVFRFFRELSVL